MSKARSPRLTLHDVWAVVDLGWATGCPFEYADLAPRALTRVHPGADV